MSRTYVGLRAGGQTEEVWKEGGSGSSHVVLQNTPILHSPGGCPPAPPCGTERLLLACVILYA